jgi:hypothetical protein
MVETKSSNIHSIGWDGKESLYVRFRDGMRLYRFYPAPEIVWLGLQQAKSKGTFFQSQIKNFFKFEVVKE